MSVLERIYFFHDRVQAGDYPNTRILMEEFEISQATANRDVRYLRDRLLAPLSFDPQKNGYAYTRSDFHLPFENSPAMILVLGLVSSLVRQSGLEELPELADMQTRLQKMLFPGQRNVADLLHCEWVEREPVPPHVFATVLSGLKNRRQLHIVYRDTRGKSSSRTVEPLKLINYQGRWYLLAWCLDRHARRLFHLARMREATLLDDPVAEERTVGDDWLQASFGIFKGPARATARLRFRGMAAELVRYQVWHDEQRLREEDDSILLELPISDERELAARVLGFGGQVEVLAPAGLRQRVIEEIRAMRKLYGL
jgi:predicted DNA-binding transcriptional regulator YafY